MKFVLLFLFLLIFVSAKSQSVHDTFSIKITNSSATVLPREFVCRIDKKDNQLNIFYSAIDGFDKAFFKDNKVRGLLNTYVSFDTNNLNPYLEHQHLLDSLRKRYSHYKKDSLSLKASDNIYIVDLVEKIISTPKEELENIEASKKVSVLDGSNYSFIMETPKATKYVSVYPILDPVLHPLLYELFDEINAIYKRNNQKDFLDKTNSVSY